MRRDYEVKAIPTLYNGIEFRSRLEARWAVFFDTLGVKYFYEYEGFQLSRWYVPDFWLPDLKTWVEIKPSDFTGTESSLCEQLARATKNNVLMVSGDVGAPDVCAAWDIYKCDPEYYGNDVGWDNNHVFCECPKCGAIGIEFEGRGARVCGSKCFPDQDRMHSADSIRLANAYKLAQKYQFAPHKHAPQPKASKPKKRRTRKQPLFTKQVVVAESPYDESVQNLLVVSVVRSSNADADRRKLTKLHSVITSYPGTDRFFVVIVDKNRSYGMHFPKHMTGYCDDMAKDLQSILGTDSFKMISGFNEIKNFLNEVSPGAV